MSICTGTVPPRPRFNNPGTIQFANGIEKKIINLVDLFLPKIYLAKTTKDNNKSNVFNTTAALLV